MALVDLVMPKLGESIMEATILKWTKKVGDPVKQDETLLEIATDKVDSEVPSTTEGVLEEILFKENDVVPIGTVIARINTSANSGNGSQAQQPTPSQNAASASNVSEQDSDEEGVPFVPKPVAQPVQTNGSANNKFYSPLVLNIANSEGVPLSELENIPGTGNEGRVTKKDILQYVADKKGGRTPAAPTQQAPTQQPSQPPPSTTR